jgi:Concanavalin A-like lectin/glucanases superfamily
VASHRLFTPISITTGAQRIGGERSRGSTSLGGIDDVRIYSTALSASEIQADMNNAYLLWL